LNTMAIGLQFCFVSLILVIIGNKIDENRRRSDYSTIESSILEFTSGNYTNS